MWDDGLGKFFEITVLLDIFVCLAQRGLLLLQQAVINLQLIQAFRTLMEQAIAEDYDRNWARLLAWDTPELRGDEYVLDEDISKFAPDAGSKKA